MMRSQKAANLYNSRYNFTIPTVCHRVRVEPRNLLDLRRKSWESDLFFLINPSWFN